MNGAEKRLKHISILFSEGSDEGEHAFHETIASKRPEAAFICPLTSGPSLDGGFDEFCEFLFICSLG